VAQARTPAWSQAFNAQELPALEGFRFRGVAWRGSNSSLGGTWMLLALDWFLVDIWAEGWVLLLTLCFSSLLFFLNF
jgi:hypothetical protein